MSKSLKFDWDFGGVVFCFNRCKFECVFSVACLAGTEEIQMMFFFYLLVLLYAAPYISDNINICTEFIPNAVPWFWNIDFILTIMIMMAQSQMLFTPVSIKILHMIQTSWILILLLFIYIPFPTLLCFIYSMPTIWSFTSVRNEAQWSRKQLYLPVWVLCFWKENAQIY